MNNNDQGYVKLFRAIEKWEWYTDVNTTKLWIHCLIKANHKPMKWQGILIDTGSFVTSYPRLSRETGLSVQCVRTSLNRLKSTNEITHQSTSRFSLICVVNWLTYQSIDEGINMQVNTLNNSQLTGNQQAPNRRPTTNKNDKNIKNEKNEKKKDIDVFIEFANGDDELLEALMLFEQMRIDKKKPMTPGAQKLLVNKLIEFRTDGEDIVECLKTSIINSWLSVYPSKNKKNIQFAGSDSKSGSRALDMLREMEMNDE